MVSEFANSSSSPSLVLPRSSSSLSLSVSMDLGAAVTETEQTQRSSTSNPSTTSLSSMSGGDHSSTSSSSSSSNGSVVESRRGSNVKSSDVNSEKIGRWSEEEHKTFLRGLEAYGKQWKTIASMIGTRTVVQVRTHAQKYFQKVERHNKTLLQPDQPGLSNNDNNSKMDATSGLLGSDPSSNTGTEPSSNGSKGNSKDDDRNNNNKNTIIKSGTALKRKSMPPSLPSRKKLKSPTKTKALTRASLSLATSAVSHSPVPELPAHTSSSSSSNSLVSEACWSTISPAAVVDLLDLNIYDTAYLNSSNNHHNINKDCDIPYTNTFDFPAFGEDPLEWLVDGEGSGIVHQYLPESSLPFFPDLSSTTSAMTSSLSSSDPSALSFGEEGEGTLSMGLAMSSSGIDSTTLTLGMDAVASNHENENDLNGFPFGETSTREMIDDAILLNIADPNVTVQSLFLSNEPSSLME